MKTIQRILLAAAFAALAVPAIAQFPGKFSIDDIRGNFLVDGKPFQILSGEMHYARIPREYWRDRLLKAKAMGMNAVATYVFWNVHEPKQGEFNFSGNEDVAAFVKTAQEVGLYVLLRPGPYACAEWDFGGYPSWLLKDTSIKVRSRDARFLSACGSYLDHLGAQLKPLLNSNGGPIILVQVENEYGSYGNDKEYVADVRDLIRHAGFNVPLMSADGSSQMPNAVLPDVLPAVNGETGEAIFTAIKRYRPNGPFLVTEFYPGWLDHWGEKHAHVDAADCAKDFAWMLDHHVSVNFYMIHGGTNFGFMSGANFGGHFQPQPTSYDYDAPIDEAGRLTPKYFALRAEVAKRLPVGEKLPDPPPATAFIEIPEVTLSDSAALFDALPKGIAADKPLAMEDLDQSYGCVLYRTEILTPIVGELAINSLRDYGLVYINGKKIASLDRRHKQYKTVVDVTTAPVMLDILVENGGRINYGPMIQDNRKGITGNVTLAGKEISGWEIYSLPMADGELPGTLTRGAGGGPEIFRGLFTLSDTGDTFLDMRGWGKGIVWVNGHNLGRHWYIGPQQTLYLPGVWLRKGNNTIAVLELEDHSSRTVRGLANPILDQLNPDKLAPAPPQRLKGTPRLEDADLTKEGQLANGDSTQTVSFPSRAGRYLCLDVLSSQEADDPFTSLAELNLLDEHSDVLSRVGWKIPYVDSEELESEDGRAENILDGDNATIWHTEWGNAQPKHPHCIIIDVGGSKTISGVRFNPRTDGDHGWIKSYRIYVRQTPFEMK